MIVRTKKKGHIRLCPENWICGSTREEMTPAERGVWIDFLALAYLNEPVGQINFITERRLANLLHVSPKLLSKTIQKAKLHGKIDIIEEQANPVLDKKKKKNDSTCDQPDSKSSTLESTQSKIGLPLRIIRILNWNKYQSDYLRQKPYRERKSAEQEYNEDVDESDEKLQNLEPENVTQVTDRGEERRGDKIKLNKRRGEENEDSDSYTNSESESLPSSNSNSPFSEEGKEVQKKEFLSMLEACPDYPFDEYEDGSFFHYALDEYPDIDILRELEKKIAWWKEHPKALKQGRKTPRGQLDEWLEKEQEFQRKKRGV